MKKIIQLAVLLFVVCLTGCASTGGYFLDRGRDVADIFTATAGVGLGARARTGPIHAGLIYNIGDTGLRAGSLISSSGRCNPVEAELIGYCYEMLSPQCMIGEENNPRCNSKGYAAESTVVPFVTTDFSPYGNQPCFPHPYWTQIEIQAALGLSLRLGFNPGELLDFILGWTTMDIYNDDLERKKQKEKIEQ